MRYCFYSVEKCDRLCGGWAQIWEMLQSREKQQSQWSQSAPQWLKTERYATALSTLHQPLYMSIPPTPSAVFLETFHEGSEVFAPQLVIKRNTKDINWICDTLLIHWCSHWWWKVEWRLNSEHWRYCRDKRRRSAQIQNEQKVQPGANNTHALKPQHSSTHISHVTAWWICVNPAFILTPQRNQMSAQVLC